MIPVTGCETTLIKTGPGPGPGARVCPREGRGKERADGIPAGPSAAAGLLSRPRLAAPTLSEINYVSAESVFQIITHAGFQIHSSPPGSTEAPAAKVTLNLGIQIKNKITFPNILVKIETFRFMRYYFGRPSVRK